MTAVLVIFVAGVLFAAGALVGADLFATVFFAGSAVLFTATFLVATGLSFVLDTLVPELRSFSGPQGYLAATRLLAALLPALFFALDRRPYLITQLLKPLDFGLDLLDVLVGLLDKHSGHLSSIALLSMTPTQRLVLSETASSCIRS